MRDSFDTENKFTTFRYFLNMYNIRSIRARVAKMYNNNYLFVIF